MKQDKNREETISLEEEIVFRMLDTFLEIIMREWAKDLCLIHRDKVVTLDNYIGRTTQELISLEPTITIYPSDRKYPPIGIELDKDETEFYIFEGDICSDAFRVPSKIESSTLSNELKEQFKRFVEAQLPD